MSIREFEGIKVMTGRNVFIDPTATVIGDVVIGDDCSVWPMAVIRGDVHFIRIGHRSNIQDGSVLHVTHFNEEYSPQAGACIIGNDVTVGHRVVAHACTVGDRVLVGMGSVILDGAVLEQDVMLGAGSLVPPGKIVESGYLWLGSPVKKIRKLTAKELQFLPYSAQHYVNLKNRY